MPSTTSPAATISSASAAAPPTRGPSTASTPCGAMPTRNSAPRKKQLENELQQTEETRSASCRPRQPGRRRGPALRRPGARDRTLPGREAAHPQGTARGQGGPRARHQVAGHVDEAHQHPARAADRHGARRCWSRCGASAGAMPSPCCARVARHEAQELHDRWRAPPSCCWSRAYGCPCTRSDQQADRGGGNVFADLKPALGEVDEIRLSKGDGSRTTLHARTPTAGPWSNATTRPTPRACASWRWDSPACKIVEAQDQRSGQLRQARRRSARHADRRQHAGRSGRRPEDLVADRRQERRGPRGLRAQARRKPPARWPQPLVSADPDQKRWIDRQLTDIPGADVHDISVKPASGPAYLLTRADRSDADLTLSPVPKGRKPASAMSLNGQADALAAFHFDDVRAAAATTAPRPATDHATYRTFDGQVIEFTGHREGDKAFVAVTAQPRSGARRAIPGAGARAGHQPAAATPVPAAAGDAGEAAGPDRRDASARAPRAWSSRSRLYKYESIFKPQEDLLEKSPSRAAKPAKPAKPAQEEVASGQRVRAIRMSAAPPATPSGTTRAPSGWRRTPARRFRACAARRKKVTPISTPISVRAPEPAERRLPNTKGTASSAANRMATVRAMRDQNANSCVGRVEVVLLQVAGSGSTARGSRADAARPR